MSSLDAVDITSYAADHRAGSMILHRVSLTDTLGSIALHYYGDTCYVKLILDHNERHIVDPNNLTVGQELVIPRHPTLRHYA